MSYFRIPATIDSSVLHLVPISTKSRSLSDLGTVLIKVPAEISPFNGTRMDITKTVNSISAPVMTSLGPSLTTYVEEPAKANTLKYTTSSSLASLLANSQLFTGTSQCSFTSKCPQASGTNLQKSAAATPQASSASNLQSATPQIHAGTGSPQVPTANAHIFTVGSLQAVDSAQATSNEKVKPSSKNSAVKLATQKPEGRELHSITKVASLVFFDLETTGLAHEIGKSNVQITEVSMISIGREEFEQCTSDQLKDIRIIQKLCLCTRPRAMVSSTAAAITGLNNQNLADQLPFEQNTAKAINFFLSHLPKPVCLIAHNGNHYDFPILKAEFFRLTMTLLPDILVADTLKAFRVLGVPVFPPERKICQSVRYTKKGQVSCGLENLHLYFFNKNPTGSHSSEGDCIALARVCHRMKDLILPWIDENCCTFDSISPMW